MVIPPRVHRRPPPARRARSRGTGSAARNLPSTLHDAAIGMALVARDGRLLEVNPALCRLTGYAESELLHHRFAMITHPDDIEDNLEQGEKLWSGEIAVYRTEKRYLHKSGETIWIELTSSLVREAGGQPSHFFSQMQDISRERAARAQLAARELQYESVAENLPGMIFRLLVARDGTVSMPFISGGCRDIYGVEPETLMTYPELLDSAIHIQDRESYEHSRLQAARELTGWDWRGRIAIAGEGIRYVHGIARPVPDGDGGVAWDGVLLDETELRSSRERAERERDAALERFRIAFDRAPIGMVILGLDGRFQRVNQAVCDITGYDAEDLLQMAPFAIVLPEDLEHARAQFTALGTSTDTVTFEHRIAPATTGEAPLIQTRATLVRDEDGSPSHVLAQYQDISERRQYEDRLKHLADHDSLTGLLNRRGLESALEAQLARCRRYGTTGALLILDLDGFKFVNDTLGHAVGDELIMSCADALTQRVRETDTVARLGGDEFAVLLPFEARDGAEAAAAGLVSTVRERAAEMSHAHPGRITASVGIAMFTDATATPDEMLVNADLAMYDAKEAGKDRYLVYEPDGHARPRIKAQMTWLERIERALIEERFELYAQPIVELASGETVQHEVLLRMLDDQGDLIPPGTFLPIAERFGIIRDLDRWVISRAIRTMAQERRHGRSLPLAVNISALSINQGDIPALIAEELAAGGVPASDLVLELTETAAVEDLPRARRFADALTEIGCCFSMDDFGAGFGSFYYLKHLPFDVIKIDGEFVRHATTNPADRLVIKAVCDIARGLGKQTVAEFVPDEETIELLITHGVDLGQGYHLGRPRPLAEICAARSADGAGAVRTA